jgi:hypothetical protein
MSFGLSIDVFKLFSFGVYKMEQVTLALYTKRLDRMLSHIADYKETEADNLIYSRQTCFSMEECAKFYGVYLRYIDILVLGVKQSYENMKCCMTNS